MQNKFILLLAGLLLFGTACVQKSYDRKVVLTLTVKGKKAIQKVGVRGDGQPLSWREDLALKEVFKDSVYTATFTTKTGYLFTNLKFTVNGEFELNDKPDRKLSFNPHGTTFYNAVFDQP